MSLWIKIFWNFTSGDTITKIAVDIAILPEGWIQDEIISISNNLKNRDDSYSVLGKQDFFPHLTLSMAAIEDFNLPMIKVILQSIVLKHMPIDVNLTGIIVKQREDGRKGVNIEVEKSTKLLALHKDIIGKLQTYLIYDGKKEMFFEPESIENLPMHWLKNHHKNSILDKYNPHITIGLGELEQKFEPRAFVATKISVCHLGKHCTCRKILFQV